MLEDKTRLLESLLDLGRLFVESPKVSLQLTSAKVGPRGGLSRVSGRGIGVSSAYQCYSGGVTEIRDRDDPRSEDAAELTLDGGHLTTRMHQTYTFRFEGVSRAVVHDVLHEYPFYNTGQQSQRYVEARKGNYLVPRGLTAGQERVYRQTGDFANEAYSRLLEALKPKIGERVRQMYPASWGKGEETQKRLEDKATKLCQEVARYVLPVAQRTTLLYTINELSLLRLFRAVQFENFSLEVKFVIARMVQEVVKRGQDKRFLDELRKPLELEERAGIAETSVLAQKEAFDEEIGELSSKLLPPSEASVLALVMAVRGGLAIPPAEMADKEVLALACDPVKNKVLADVFESGMHHGPTKYLRQIQLTFLTRLSHTADSQRQRQRRTPGAAPPLEALYSGKPDYITPLVIRENPELRSLYDEAVERIFEGVERAIESGIPKEWALMLLPNALTIRLVESGDLFDWFHRWKDRLCFLAQEEISFISMEQAEQVLNIFPWASQMLLAKCGVRARAGIRPKCPEGKKWCGQEVFDWPIEEYQKHRLI